VFQGFTYVAPSVLEEMYKPHVVKARSPRKGIHPRHPFSPRHHLLQHQVSPAGAFGVAFDQGQHMSMGQNQNHIQRGPIAAASESINMISHHHMHQHHHQDLNQEEMMDMGVPHV
jgi:hypothetical protein